MFICTGCQKEYENQTKFCSECGGKVIEKVDAPPVYACCQCKKEYDENTKFCSECGGKVEIQQVAAQAVTSSPVQQVKSVPSNQAGNILTFYKAFFKPYKFATKFSLKEAYQNCVVLSTTGSKIWDFLSFYRVEATLSINADEQGKLQAVVSKKKIVPTAMGWSIIALSVLLAPITLFASLMLIPIVVVIQYIQQGGYIKSVIDSQLLWFNLLAPHSNCFTLPETASYDLSGKTPAEIAAIAFKNLGNSTNMERRLAGALESSSVCAAINSYANGVSESDVICQLYPNNTDGSTGTLFTTNGIYSKIKIGIFSVQNYIAYNEICSAGNFNSLLCKSTGELHYWCPATMPYNQIKEQLNNEENCLTEQKELLEFIRAMQCRS